MNKLICTKCLDEEYLIKKISHDGDTSICSYCKKGNKTIELEKLGDYVHTVLEEHFHLTPDEPNGIESLVLKDKELDYNWERRGDSIDYLLYEILGISEEIIKDLLDYLSYTYSDIEAAKMGLEDPYDEEAYYEKMPLDLYEIKESWGKLCSEIKTRARFFSPVIKDILDELFKDLNRLNKPDGTKVIKTLFPDNDTYIYRGRVAQSKKDISNILISPSKELGAPPSQKALAGRMNPAGISVFYGATNQSTCIAEVRPPVGSSVVIGKYKILREIRLLNMNALREASINEKLSIFDPNTAPALRRVAFLRQLVHELTKPIMPSDEEFEYLPTQAIAEYLSERVEPKLDGIVFHSSQSSEEGDNIVLFNHASDTEPYITPHKTKSYVRFGGQIADDEFNENISIFEEIPANTQDHLGENLRLKSFSKLSALIEKNNTLELIINEIEVKRIRGVTYDTASRSVNYHRNKAINK